MPVAPAGGVTPARFGSEPAPGRAGGSPFLFGLAADETADSPDEGR